MREDNPQDESAQALLHAPRVVSGEAAEYVVTHPGRSQYRQDGGGGSACGIAALNCARIVLGLHATGLGSVQLVQELVKRTMLEASLPFLFHFHNLILHDRQLGRSQAVCFLVELHPYGRRRYLQGSNLPKVPQVGALRLRASWISVL